MLGKIAFAKIEKEKEKFIGLAKNMWETPETAFNEVNACKWTTDLLREFGFETEVGYAGLPTCVMGRWGSGHPVVGILGELDALPGLSQKVSTIQDPVVKSGAGHGCGHNLLNGAALAAAVGIKAEMEEKKIPGTVIFYGCPAEEVLTGKPFMARAGAFRELDCAISYHGNARNIVETGNSNGLNNVVFHFSGRTSHAGSNPWDGRSALDAAELTSVGANYLREHVTPDIRIHYSYIEAGTAPNVVPDRASVWYYVRGASRKNIEDAYARLIKVAEGAAHMTETELEVELKGGCYNSLKNVYFSELAYEAMKDAFPPEWTEEELKFADELNQVSPRLEQTRAMGRLDKGPLHTEVCPCVWNNEIGGGSTDLSDVCHICPTVAIDTATYNMAGMGHSWQITACAGMSIGFKGMLYGGRCMALTALKVLTEPEHLEKISAEFKERMNGDVYQCPIPDFVPVPQPDRVRK